MVNLDLAPRIGATLCLGDQIYRLVGAKDYIRSDGQPSFVLFWESDCPNCARPFEVSTGLVAKQINRRCPRCKRPGSRVKRGRKRRVKVRFENAA